MTTIKQTGFCTCSHAARLNCRSQSDENIVSGETSIPSQGDNMPAFHARPGGVDGPLPVVIVVQEIFGVHEHIRDICRRLAKEGYLAIAPGSTSARAILMITATSLLCSRDWSKGAGFSGAGRPRSRGQLGLPPRRRCPSLADYRLLLGRAYFGCTLHIIRS